MKEKKITQQLILVKQIYIILSKILTFNDQGKQMMTILLVIYAINNL